MSERPTCLIPARGGSKRFPRKNIAPLAGKPLLGWTVETAIASGIFSDVVVSTDDEEVAAVARHHGATTVARPPALAGDTATVVQVMLDFADGLVRAGRRADLMGVVLPTAALMVPDDLRRGFAMLDADTECVMSVTRFHEPPFWALHEVDGFVRPFWPEHLKRSQELPAVWVDCGYYYLARVDAVRRDGKFYGPRVRGCPVPRLRSVDIDVAEDFELAEALFALGAKRSAAIQT